VHRLEAKGWIAASWELSDKGKRAKYYRLTDGVTPNDPLAIALGVITLVAAALLAAYVPARQASHIDPPVALRHD
jgi:hypothetical protein